MHSTEIRGTSVLILGYGREGQSSHRWLLQHRSDLRIAIADKQTVTLIAEAPKETVIFSGPDYLAKASDYDTILRSPGIPLRRGDLEPLYKQGAHISSLTNIFLEISRENSVGISGTKGKSTTSSLLHNILKQSNPDTLLVGNIGTPALDCLSDATTETLFVTELSSFQLEDLRHPPRIAVLLDIMPEHLDHHGTFEEYRAAKLNIAGDDTHLVCKASSEAALRQTFSAKQAITIFSESSDHATNSNCAAYCDDGTYYYRLKNDFSPLCTDDELTLAGGTNSLNILAALSVASLQGISLEVARRGLLSFQALPYRLENIGERKGVTYINDSLATIPQACIHALESLGEQVETLIVGGHDRGVPYDELADAIAAHAASLVNVILLPDTGRQIAELLRTHHQESLEQLTLHPVPNLAEAVKIAVEQTSRGRVCLLSPASSSLNQFRDYKERGDIFRELVEEYTQE